MDGVALYAIYGERGKRFLVKGRRSLTRFFVFILLLALLAPLLPFVLWGFGQSWLFPHLLPEEWGLRTWSYLFRSGSQLGRALSTSLGIGFAVALLSLLIGLPAGRILGLYHFRGKAMVKYLILSPAIVPPFAAAMGIHVIFIRYGLAETLLGVILVHLIPALPYVVLVLSGIFAGYNPDMEEEARTLGARRWQVFRYVTMPSIFPGVLVAGLLAFTTSWCQYLLTLLIGGGQVLTLPILLLNFLTSGDYAMASALCLVMIFPAGIVLWFVSRLLNYRGIALGGFGRL